MGKDYRTLLLAPFPIEDVEFRVGSTNRDKTKGMALAYITSRAVMDRLDEVFGVGGWEDDYELWRGKGVKCTIRANFDGDWINKTDGADDTDFEATKGGFSDSFKRAGVKFGIGRYLYQLPAVWVPIAPAGKSFKFSNKDDILRKMKGFYPKPINIVDEKVPEKPKPKPPPIPVGSWEDARLIVAPYPDGKKKGQCWEKFTKQEVYLLSSYRNDKKTDEFNDRINLQSTKEYLYKSFLELDLDESDWVDLLKGTFGVDSIDNLYGVTKGAVENFSKHKKKIGELV